MDSLYDINEYDDDRNRRSGLWISIFIHLLILLLFIAPLFNQFPKSNEEFKGVLVVFGDHESGGASSPEIAEEQIEDEEVPETEWEEQEEEVESNVEEEMVKDVITEKAPKEVVEAPPVLTKVFDNDAEIIANQEKEKNDQDQKKKEAEEKAQQLAEKQKAEEAQKIKEQQEKLEREKQAAAAAKKAKEEKEKAERLRKEKELEEKKRQYGDLFNNGTGDAQADNSKGDPIGDPDGAALEGISTGQAEIGGGLSDRGVAYEPAIKDNSQKTGKVVVRVCVNRDGQVIEAKYTQKGSNTTDRTLVEIAEKAAAKYTFTASDIDKQCGTIAIDFKLK